MIFDKNMNAVRISGTQMRQCSGNLVLVRELLSKLLDESSLLLFCCKRQNWLNNRWIEIYFGYRGWNGAKDSNGCWN